MLKGGKSVISIFGVLSLFVLGASIWAMVSHHRVMRKRSVLDNNLEELYALLHDRLDMLMVLSERQPENPEYSTLFDAYADRDARALLRALPKINKALSPLNDEPVFEKELTHNAEYIKKTAKAYNESIIAYNGCIARFPGMLVAFMVGIKQEKPLSV
jgi:hypothetical protein